MRMMSAVVRLSPPARWSVLLYRHLIMPGLLDAFESVSSRRNKSPVTRGGGRTIGIRDVLIQRHWRRQCFNRDSQINGRVGGYPRSRRTIIAATKFLSAHRRSVRASRDSSSLGGHRVNHAAEVGCRASRSSVVASQLEESLLILDRQVISKLVVAIEVGQSGHGCRGDDSSCCASL